MANFKCIENLKAVGQLYRLKDIASHFNVSTKLLEKAATDNQIPLIRLPFANGKRINHCNLQKLCAAISAFFPAEDRFGISNTCNNDYPWTSTRNAADILAISHQSMINLINDNYLKCAKVSPRIWRVSVNDIYVLCKGGVITALPTNRKIKRKISPKMENSALLVKESE